MGEEGAVKTGISRTKGSNHMFANINTGHEGAMEDGRRWQWKGECERRVSVREGEMGNGVFAQMLRKQVKNHTAQDLKQLTVRVHLSKMNKK